jgi:para-nitrobenzyl esterase
MQTRANVELAGRGRAGGRGGRGGGRGRGAPGGSPPPASAPGAAAPPAAVQTPPAAPAEAAAPPALPTLAELRARSTEQIQQSLGGAGQIVDGHIIPEDLSITYAAGRQNPVDVLVGSNKDEHTTMGGNVAMRDTMSWGARLFAERQTRLGKKAFWYYFTHLPPVEPGKTNPGATHASEMVYVFNNLHAPRMIPDASSPKLAVASEEDRKIADMMSSYWTNFAKTGDPNGKGLPEWPRFKDRNAPPHVIGEIQEYVPAGTLNMYDQPYAELLGTLSAAAKQ